MSRLSQDSPSILGDSDQRRILSVLIGRELAGRMIDHCKVRGVDMSRAVSRALDYYLENCHGEGQHRSHLELGS